MFADPSGPKRTVEVRPLEKAPDIATPKVGAPAFEGDPPPWRAPMIAQQKLLSLDSYWFRTKTSGTEQMGSFGEEAQGRLTKDAGSLTGTVPGMDERTRESEPQTVRAELTYMGPKVWLRVGDGGWRRTDLRGLVGGGPGDEESAFRLLSLISTGPPEHLVPAEMAEMGEEQSAFGMDVAGGMMLDLPMPIVPGTLANGRLVGVDTINGIRSLHYEGEVPPNPMMGGPTDSPTAVELWLAADGGYLVRSRQELSWGMGSGEILVDVRDANKPVDIRPPLR